MYDGQHTSKSSMLSISSFLHKNTMKLYPLVHSVQYIGRLTKILIRILEVILKKIPMSAATMSR